MSLRRPTNERGEPRDFPHVRWTFNRKSNITVHNIIFNGMLLIIHVIMHAHR
jgi:hypothetical protein